MLRHGSRRAITLVEVLVIIAVVGLLAALAIPALQSVRAASRRTQCKSQLRQIGLALAGYFDSHGTTRTPVYPWAAAVPSASPGMPSIRTVLEPWIEDNEAVFRCPEDTHMFATERVSYEYNQSLSGQRLSAYRAVLWDFQPVHAETQNFLYSDGTAR